MGRRRAKCTTSDEHRADSFIFGVLLNEMDRLYRLYYRMIDLDEFNDKRVKWRDVGVPFVS